MALSTIDSVAAILFSSATTSKPERLALRLSSGLYADREIYDRLVRDVTVIRGRDPRLKSVSYFAQQNVRILNVYFKPSDFWLVRAHLYWDWNCLNRFLGAEVVLHPRFARNGKK